MTVPGNLSSPLLATAGDSAAAAFQIDRSLRFNSDDDTYLFRDPSSHGNRKVFTFSFWVKRAKLGTVQLVLYIRSGPGNTGRVRFDSSDRLEVESEISGSAVAKKVTSAKFRDCSAWQHFVVKFDAVNTNCDIYHNGVELTDFDTNTEPTNVDHYFGGDFQHYIGGYADSSNVDGYLAEVHYIDGSALDESSFGQFDSNSVWQPKQYSGTYGTNGFYLNFSDNSSNAALGTDSSGNDNTWTVYNLTAEGIDANTSQTWSSSQTGYHNSGAASAFDGDFSTSGFAGGGASANAYVDFSAINASKVEVYVSAYGSGSAGGYWYARQTNGTQHTYTITSSGTSLGWVTVYDGSQIQINRLGGARDSDGDAGSAQRAWRVDGKILVNSGTSGVGLQSTDSLIDTPTNYTADSGNNGGNYCTWNPFENNGTLSNGNLDIVTPNGGTAKTLGTIAFPSSGKYYFEVTPTNNGDQGYVYIGDDTVKVANAVAYYANNGQKRVDGTFSSYGATWDDNDVIGCAVNVDDGEVTFYKNGSSQGTISYTISGKTLFPGVSDGTSGSGTTFSANFGQRPFAYTPPTGFVSLCTTNLPDPTIADGSTAFDVKLWTSTTAGQTISGYNFSPDFLWSKSRSGTYAWGLWDTVRGATKLLISNGTGDEKTDSVGLTAFTSDGFTAGTDGGYGTVNYQSGNTYVGFAWDAGTSTASNTDGSITSNVRANTSAGFSVVSWDGTSANATVGHGLNAAPEFIITKVRGMTSNWYCYHAGLTDATKYIWLNSTAAEGTQTAAWNSTDPTSSVIHVGGEAEVNRNGYNTIAYCFAPVEGFSAFNSYATNGLADGPFVYTGFRPRWALLKESSASGELWVVYDSARNTSNVMGKQLYPSSSAAEADASADTHARIDFLSNGFKIRGSHSSINTNGETIIYAAFAEHPFKTARAR